MRQGQSQVHPSNVANCNRAAGVPEIVDLASPNRCRRRNQPLEGVANEKFPELPNGATSRQIAPFVELPSAGGNNGGVAGNRSPQIFTSVIRHRSGSSRFPRNILIRRGGGVTRSLRFIFLYGSSFQIPLSLGKRRSVPIGRSIDTRLGSVAPAVRAGAIHPRPF